MMKHKMQDDIKKGIKRKIEIESKGTKTKAPLKADLIIQLKEAQEKCNALEATNKRNIEIKNREYGKRERYGIKRNTG